MTFQSTEISRGVNWRKLFDDLKKRPNLSVDCDHPNTSICRKVKSNGSIEVRKQCLGCGINLHTLRHSDLQRMGLKLQALPNWDDTIHARMIEAWQSDEENRKARWQHLYQDYLHSLAWHEKRQRVLRRDNNVCQACLINEACQVHHLSYDHVGDEPLFQLVSVCVRCHRKLHETRAQQ